jgi:hypothetical protein
MVPLVRKMSGGASGSPSGVKPHTSRPREDERHQRGSSRPTTKRENAILRHRAQGKQIPQLTVDMPLGRL